MFPKTIHACLGTIKDHGTVSHFYFGVSKVSFTFSYLIWLKFHHVGQLAFHRLVRESHQKVCNATLKCVLFCWSIGIILSSLHQDKCIFCTCAHPMAGEVFVHSDFRTVGFCLSLTNGISWLFPQDTRVILKIGSLMHYPDITMS